MKRLLSLPLLALVASCSSGGDASPARVEAADAVCRPAATGRDVTGCYVTLTASRDDRLVSAASPAAREIQIHEMKSENGMMRMAELPDGLALPAGEATHLSPGGNHLMLLGASTPLAEGGTIAMTLTFEHAPPLDVSFRIGQPDAAHAGH